MGESFHISVEILNEADYKSVFNLGNFKGGHFPSISDENKTLFSISPVT